MIEISQRLRLIAEQIPAGSVIADIGSDHALLPSYLIMYNRIERAIAGEVKKGPLQAAQRNVEALGFSSRIEVRLGNGLEVIEPGEVDTVVIAGMGGTLIARILDEGKARLTGVARLVLQPNVAEADVRKWLLAHGWYLEKELIMEEDSYIYEILVAVKGNDNTSDNLYKEVDLSAGCVVGQERLLQMGPHLLQASSDIFIEKWKRELDKLRWIRAQLQQSATEEAKQKDAYFAQEIKEIMEVLLCLQRDKPSLK